MPLPPAVQFLAETKGRGQCAAAGAVATGTFYDDTHQYWDGTENWWRLLWCHLIVVIVVLPTIVVVASTTKKTFFFWFGLGAVVFLTCLFFFFFSNRQHGRHGYRFHVLLVHSFRCRSSRRRGHGILRLAHALQHLHP
jgi:hypothetical protein